MINMRIFQKLTALAVLVFIGQSALAYKYYGNTVGTGPEITTQPQGMDDSGSRAASCSPATGLKDLEWNNVRARIETGGNMWQDRANNRAAYEVPKPADGEQGVSSLFAGGLWMGGRSLDQTLKLAAVTFRGRGNDYWPGPLSNDGTAEITPEVCLEYDDFAVTQRQDTQKHKQYFDMQLDGSTPEEIADAFPDGYIVPGYFSTYPAMGNTAAGQDLYLAPFKDYNNNGIYDPENGDYPWYDFEREIDCAKRQSTDKIPLFGDQTYYWIFNDKGNIHTESQGQAIGMEVRAQAFAFTTNDEVNNMTFLNYVLINQGSQTLTETFFGSWVDPDLGFSQDDYVGCDVQRGLGYCYNGDAFDEPASTSLGYGQNPPAVGIDFFEGPYQDNDTMANPLTSDIAEAIALKGIPYKGLGIGYGDTIVDNERFGMRRFVYYNANDNPTNGEPATPQHYYNYLKGIWKDGSDMSFGGNGANTGTVSGLGAQYMFPGDSDPLNWSTGGEVPPLSAMPWTEQTAGNLPYDRRFVQSAGPFTLLPGDYNNITLGVVWARAIGGDPYESVELLRLADDKAQSLFDNCFELVNGPDAPDVTVQELDKEVILMLTNENPLSNNYQENYLEFDPAIPDSISNGTSTIFLSEEDRSYRFEGYLVYQLANSEVSNADLSDINKARLIAQCDVQNEVVEIINYNRDQTTGLITPQLMVQGLNAGVSHSFRVVQDAFALGNNTLINHKTYYFMVVAYGYNNYQDYDVATSTGQDDVFKASRKAAVGEVVRIAAIPHNVTPESAGTILNSGYGDGVMLTRIEGKGNGKNDMILSAKSESEILAAPFRTSALEYMPGAGPVSIKVVDPLRVPASDFELRMNDFNSYNDQDVEADSITWTLKNITDGDEYTSIEAFSTLNEDLVLDYGISVTWGQYTYLNEDGDFIEHFTDFIDASIEFADPSKAWLGGVFDADGFSESNWIRSGTVESTDNTPDEETPYDDFKDGTDSEPFTDGGEVYEKVLNGTWSPYCLVSYSTQVAINGVDTWFNIASPTSNAMKGDLSPIGGAEAKNSNIKGLNNVDVVFTSDKSKWTRCPVLEMQSITTISEDLLTTTDFPGMPAAPEKMRMRQHLSVDKNGRTANDPGFNEQEGNMTGAWGLGWFPGYAIDVGTGERLNMAFGEDSWLVGENGNDMIWNPTGNYIGGNGQAIFGGQHWIYIFKNGRNETQDLEELGDFDEDYVGRYDSASYMFNRYKASNYSAGDLKKLFRACTWVGSSIAVQPLLTPEQGLIPTDARVKLRVAKPYAPMAPDDSPVNLLPNSSSNNWRNLYTFSTRGLAPVLADAATLESALDMINIVPNPYYAFSSYESSKLDNRVKITNLPYECTVSIYDLNGTLIRHYKKSDPTTSLDWDLKNGKNIPIASGTYIVHINVPGAGEKILKWFGVMRPIDLDSF